jgi:hypothetical protein
MKSLKKVIAQLKEYEEPTIEKAPSEVYINVGDVKNFNEFRRLVSQDMRREMKELGLGYPEVFNEKGVHDDAHLTVIAWDEWDKIKEFAEDFLTSNGYAVEQSEIRQFPSEGRLSYYNPETGKYFDPTRTWGPKRRG